MDAAAGGTGSAQRALRSAAPKGVAGPRADLGHDRGRGVRDLRRLGRPPAAKPQQLGKDQRAVVAEPRGTRRNLQLPRRPAVCKRRRGRRAQVQAADGARRADYGGIRNLAATAARQALAASPVQNTWKQANQAADQTFVTIVNGGDGALQVNRGQVSLNLAAIVADITNRLGLPNLGSKLPPSVANLKILKSNQIELIQDGGKALKGLALLLPIGVPLLYALALWLARGYRRRTIMKVGIAIAFAGAVVLLARTALVSQVTDSLVKSDSVRPAATAVVSIATSMLSDIAGACAVVGVALIAAAWFAGPAQIAVTGRRAIAPFLRDRPNWTYGIVAATTALIFTWQPIPATGTPIGIITFLALAFLGTMLLRRRTAVEFPDA